MPEGLSPHPEMPPYSSEEKDSTVKETTVDSSQEQRTEGQLVYEDVLNDTREKLHIRNPRGWLNSIIFRRYMGIIEKGFVTYDEMYHEAVVGLYLGMDKLDNQPTDPSVDNDNKEDWRMIANKVNKHLSNYVYTFTKQNTIHGSEIPFSAMAGTEVESVDDLRDKLTNEQGEGNDPTEELLRGMETQELLAQAKDVILSHEKRPGQGQRDWEVFTRHITGQTPQEIIENCDWLKTTDSVDSAIVRISKLLRSCFDGDVNAPVITSPTRRQGGGGRTVDQSEYYRQWYERNKASRQEHMRNYKREKRQAAKLSKQQEAETGEVEDNTP